VSSRGLADRCQLNAALVRKDLAYFGEFGVRGVGYYVKDLKRHLKDILGLNRSIKVIIVGAGHLGFALAGYPGFRAEGFDVVAMFDIARDKVGRYSKGGVIVRHMRDLAKTVEREHIDIGVIAVPGDVAQGVADALTATGVCAILNFARGTLRVPDRVKLKNVDLSVSLASLSFFLAQPGGQP
jgi:redox-sensing transcriptional repressor